MRFALASAAALFALVAAQDPAINTPASLVQCQPAQLTWSSTHLPVFVSIIPGGQPGAAALQDFGPQNSNSLTWLVNIPAGQSVTMQVRDSQGAVAYSAPSTIQSSSDTSCLGQNPSGPPSGSASTTATATAPGSVPPTTSAASSTASSAVPSVSSSSVSVTSAASSAVSSASRSASAATSRASASASPSPNAAMANAGAGFAGLLGLAAAVVMA